MGITPVNPYPIPQTPTNLTLPDMTSVMRATTTAPPTGVVTRKAALPSERREAATDKDRRVRDGSKGRDGRGAKADFKV